MRKVSSTHKNEYSTLPKVTATAPGRFHLIGEHSWFFRDKTLSMAIDLPVYVAISKRKDTSLKFYFYQMDDRKRANISSLKFRKEDRWANAIKAMIFGFISSNFALSGMNITVYSDILPSAGFGITTAMKVATVVAINELFSLNCTDSDILKIIEKGNKSFLETGNYIADNFAALYAKKDSLIITDHANNSYDCVDFPFKDKTIMLTDTKVPRISVWNEKSLYEGENALLLGDLRVKKRDVYGSWRYESNITEINEVLSVANEDIRRKLLCIIREHNDLLDAHTALVKNDFGKFARAVNNSHESMRDLFEHSCPEIDWILKRVGELEPNLERLGNPVTCGRITGKGFGRCLYAFIRQEDIEEFENKLVEYERIFGFHPCSYKVLPSGGAHIVK